MPPGRPGHRAPLLWLLLPLMAGLAAGRLADAPVGALAAVALAAAGVALACARSVRPWALRCWPAAIALALAAAGAASYHARLARPMSWETLPPREARLTVRLDQMFTPRADGRRAGGLGTVTGAEPHLRDLVGRRVYCSLNLPAGAPPPLPSTEVRALGVLELLPRHPPAGGFTSYLANAGINFTFTRARLLATVTPASRYRRFCHAAEGRFHAILGAGLADQPALAAVLRAMMLGHRQEMNAEQQELFLHSGTMHLFAISGLNVTAIAVSVQILLALVRVPRLPAAAVGLALLWLYVDITGASTSAVRAFLMSTLFIASMSLRQPGNPVSALAASALLVLLLDPMQLFGAGFQMSYGIVAVLLLLGVPLAEAMLGRWPLFASLPEADWGWMRHRASHGWRWLLGMAGIGLATSLVGAISGIQFFQLFTPGAVAVNLVLIPASTLVIGAGFLSLLCGLAGLAAGSVLFNHAGALLLWFMDFLLRGALVVPGVYRAAQFRAPWMGPALLAGLLAVCLMGYAGRWQGKHGGFWPPFVFVVLGLLVTVRLGP
jgi:competence protein ComEC